MGITYSTGRKKKKKRGRKKWKVLFYNLLGNAIKFSDPDQTRQPGWISLRLEVAPVKPLQFIYRISENGIGMTPETVVQPFTPLSQGEMSTTRRFGGSGLGLTICRCTAPGRMTPSGPSLWPVST